MFEEVSTAWLRYAALLAKQPGHDVPHEEIAEIHSRFGQMDLILTAIGELLHKAARAPDAERRTALEQWDWISIHTDSLYFVAWRTIDLLNGRAGRPLPHLTPIQAAELQAVRETPLENPERQGDYYRHVLGLRDEILDAVNRATRALGDGRDDEE